jgi:hypothetical protein
MSSAFQIRLDSLKRCSMRVAINHGQRAWLAAPV